MLGICSASVLVLHERLLVPVRMYGSETMLGREKMRCRIRAAQMNNLRIARYEGWIVPNAQIRVFCGVKK